MKKPMFFFEETYQMNFYFCPAFTHEEFSKAVMNNFDAEHKIKGDTSGHCVKVKSSNGVTGIFIWLKDYQMTSRNIATLVHECIHAANFVFDRAGVKLCTDNDEHQAYYTTYIFENCMRGWVQFDE